MVAKAKQQTASVMNTPPNRPKPLEKAAMASSAPSPPSRCAPEVRMASAVIVHMTIVSKKTSKIPHIPWRTGSFTLGGGIDDDRAAEPGLVGEDPARHAVADGVREDESHRAAPAARRVNASDRMAEKAAGMPRQLRQMMRTPPRV